MPQDTRTVEFSRREVTVTYPGFEPFVLRSPSMRIDRRIDWRLRSPERFSARAFSDDLIAASLAGGWSPAGVAALPPVVRGRLQRGFIDVLGAGSTWRRLYGSHLTTDERLVAVMRWRRDRWRADASRAVAGSVGSIVERLRAAREASTLTVSTKDVFPDPAGKGRASGFELMQRNARKMAQLDRVLTRGVASTFGVDRFGVGRRHAAFEGVVVGHPLADLSGVSRAFQGTLGKHSGLDVLTGARSRTARAGIAGSFAEGLTGKHIGLGFLTGRRGAAERYGIGGSFADALSARHSHLFGATASTGKNLGLFGIQGQLAGLANPRGGLAGVYSSLGRCGVGGPAAAKGMGFLTGRSFENVIGAAVARADLWPGLKGAAAAGLLGSDLTKAIGGFRGTVDQRALASIGDVLRPLRDAAIEWERIGAELDAFERVWGGDALWYLLEHLDLRQLRRLSRLNERDRRLVEAVLVEALESVVRDEGFSAALRDAVGHAHQLSNTQREHLKHALVHARAGEWLHASPPLMRGLEGAFWATARARQVITAERYEASNPRKRVKGVERVIRLVVEDHELLMFLLLRVFGTTGDPVRHGDSNDEDRAHVLLAVAGLCGWLDAFVGVPALEALSNELAMHLPAAFARGDQGLLDPDSA